MTDITDIKSVRKKRKAVKILSRLTILFFVIIIAILGVVFRENIFEAFSFLEPSEFSKKINGYPQTINGTQVKKSFTQNNSLFVLTDMVVSVYSDDGKKVSHIQHSFSNPDIAVSNSDNEKSEYFILFARGSNKLTLYTKDKEIYSIKTEQPIVQAAVSKTGKVAIATASETTNTNLFVYSKQNVEILKWNSTQQITSLVFNDNDKNIIVSSVYTNEGTINTDINNMNFNKEEPDYKTTLTDEMILSIQQTTKQETVVIGDKKCYLINSLGSIINSFEYKNTLKAFKAQNDILIIITQRDSNLFSSTIYVYDKNLELLKEINIDNQIKGINISGNKIFATTDRAIYVYDNLGEFEKEIISDGAFLNACYLNEKYISISLNKIDVV